LNAIDRFHAANEVLRFGDRFEFCLDNSNWDRGWRGLLRKRWEDSAKSAYQWQCESHDTLCPQGWSTAGLPH
jgi:hypothetical protein